MPLIKNILELQILAACQKLSNNTTSLQQAQLEFAKELSTAIDSYLKTATVIVQPGQLVVGASSAGPVTGTTTSPGTATIT
jgi:hypothetical protein